MIQEIRYTLSIELHGTEEHRGNHWALRLNDFGWTLYASTQEGLGPRVTNAFRLFVNAYAPTLSDAPKLRAYLDKHAIKHALTKEEASFPEPAFFFYRTQSPEGTFHAHQTVEMKEPVSA